MQIIRTCIVLGMNNSVPSSAKLSVAEATRPIVYLNGGSVFQEVLSQWKAEKISKAKLVARSLS